MPEKPVVNVAPPKQVVSKQRYLLLHGRKLWFYSTGIARVCFAGGYLTFGIYVISHWKGNRYGFPEYMRGTFGASLIGVGFAAMTAFMFYEAIKWLRRSRQYGKEIAPVLPLTKRNTLLIPSQEILVRSSDTPATEQHDSLLRAVQKGPDTPSEQLLRAGQAEIE
ncbi:MAG: hypothetical protein JWN14_252 [Chthonomonadales bacterium]|nr:hypothetical protein [Chthonomonadales bacterium]